MNLEVGSSPWHEICRAAKLACNSIAGVILSLGLSRAGVAQLVEHLICNQRVGGSNPSASWDLRDRDFFAVGCGRIPRKENAGAGVFGHEPFLHCRATPYSSPVQFWLGSSDATVVS